MRENDPFRLYPAYRDYIWGGNKLKTDYHKADLPCDPLAECWELSAHPDGECVFYHNGAAVPLSRYIHENPDAVGAGGVSEDGFPVLVKLIDARENLSIQVHPPDEIARASGHPRGKTELWHILEADSGAGIYLGLNRQTTKDELSARIADGTITELLKWYPVTPGESYMVTAGELHAIGQGVLLLEVQESCDITYRIYDYGRVGADGKPRALHIEQALRCASLVSGSAVPPGASDWVRSAEGDFRHIVACPYFHMDELLLHGKFSLRADGRSFVHLIAASGEARVSFDGGGFMLRQGESAFLPAGGFCTLKGNADMILTGR